MCMYVYPIRYRNKVYKGKSNSKRVLFIKKSQQATNQKHQKPQQQNIHLKIRSGNTATTTVEVEKCKLLQKAHPKAAPKQQQHRRNYEKVIL